MNHGITRSIKTTPGPAGRIYHREHFYGTNEDLHFCNLICDRSVSLIIQAFDRQDLSLFDVSVYQIK